MSRLLAFCFLYFVTLVDSVNVTYYTTRSPPFSYEDGRGLTKDVIDEILKFTTNVQMEIVVLDGNEEIFQALEARNDTADNFSLGGASITITNDREARVDFLPSYYNEGGLKVLAHSNASWSDLIKKVCKNLLVTFGLFVLGMAIMISVVGGIVWFFEFRSPEKGKLPLFFSGEDIQDTEDKKIVIKGKHIFTITSNIKAMAKEIYNAYYWTTLTLAGSEIDNPNSAISYTIQSMLKMANKMIFILAIAVFTNVINKSTTTTKINGFGDLKGETICTDIGTTSEKFLDMNNFGYTVKRLDDLNKMFQAFWDGECEAVVYDNPLLKSAINERERLVGSVNAVIVGDFLTIENYGIATSQTLPRDTYEILKQEIIRLTGNKEKMDDLTKPWLQNSGGNEGDRKSDIPTWVWVLISITGLTVLMFLVLGTCGKYTKKSLKYKEMEENRYDDDYEDDLERLEALESDKSLIHRDVTWKMNKIVVPMTMRILRILMEDDEEKKVRLDKMKERLSRRKVEDQIEKGLIPLGRPPSDEMKQSQRHHEIEMGEM